MEGSVPSRNNRVHVETASIITPSRPLRYRRAAFKEDGMEEKKNIVAPANGTQNLKVFVATVIQSIEPIFGV